MVEMVLHFSSDKKYENETSSDRLCSNNSFEGSAAAAAAIAAGGLELTDDGCIIVP